jgi:hypothetical protein
MKRNYYTKLKVFLMNNVWSATIPHKEIPSFMELEGSLSSSWWNLN